MESERAASGGGQSEKGAAPAGFARRFGAGMGYPWKGVAFVAEHPRLLALCLAPIGVAALGAILVFGAAVRFASSLAERWAGHGWLAGLLFVLLMVLVGVVLLYVGFVALVSLAAAPLAGPLSARVEAIAAGRAPPAEPIARVAWESLRGVVHSVLRLACYAAVMTPLALVGLVLPPLGMVVVPVEFVVTSLFLAFDFLDYPLSRRALGFAEKWAFIGRHRAEALGFGLAVGLLLLVPLANLLVAPFAVAGATLLHLDLARAEAARATSSSPPAETPSGGAG